MSLPQAPPSPSLSSPEATTIEISSDDEERSCAEERQNKVYFECVSDIMCACMVGESSAYDYIMSTIGITRRMASHQRRTIPTISSD